MTSKPASGGRIKAANTPAPYLLSAPCTSALTSSSTTLTDIPGCTVTFTTANPNASVLVTGIFDIDVATSGGSVALGYCVVDGAVQNGQATQQLATTATRNTCAQVWNVSLPTAGTHTIKLQGALSVAVGSAVYETTHTNLNLLVLDW